MVYLADELVFEEIFPKRDLVPVKEVVRVVEPMFTHFWESVAAIARSSSSREKPCNQHNWKQTLCHFR